jgi:teichuronic acid exporter
MTRPKDLGDINASVMSGLRWATFSRFFAQLLTWANTFLVIRLISPTDFGLTALAGLFTNFLSMLNELGFSISLVQRQVRDEETLSHVFGALLLVGTTLTAGLFLSAPLVGLLVKDPRVVPLIRLSSVLFLTMSFSVIPQARMTMDFSFRKLSAIDVASSLIGAATTLIMALNNGGAWSLITGSVVIGVSRTILLNVYGPRVLRPRFGFAKLRGLAGFSGLVLVEKTLFYWYMQVDSFVVGRSLGAAELGIYAVGRQLTNIPLERAMGIINSIAIPAFSLVKDDLVRVRAGYLKVLRLGAGYAFPVFWGLAAVSQPFVRLVIGTKWIAAATVIQVLCIAMPLRMLNALTAPIVTSIARQDVTIKSLVLAMVLIPTCVLIGRHWGLTGVAAAWAIGFPVVYLFNVALARRALGLSLPEILSAIWFPALAAAIMVSAIGALDFFWLDSLHPLASLAIAVPFGAIVFVASLWLLSRRTALEILMLARGLVRRAA